MRTAMLLALTLAASFTARADFSYTTARKSAQSPAPGADPQTTKHYLKGQKMKLDLGDTATIVDFDAQTVTTIVNSRQTYSVTKLSEMGQALNQAGVDAKMDVKETGQHKTINGFEATEIIMTIAIDSPEAGRPAGMKMTMEMDMWSSPDVPGAQELRAFYQRNGSRFPWAATGTGGNPGIQKAMADLQRKMAASGGVPVLQVVRVKTTGNEAQMAQAQAGMAQARARLEEMKKQGGQQAAMAEQALARMGGMSGGGPGALFETTMESSGFSTSDIPDSVFAIPAGYQMTVKK